MQNLVPITLFISAALMVIAIAYFRTRENMAMIEKGMNPKDKIGRPAPFVSLKFGLLLIGAGSGLLLAYLIDEMAIKSHDTDAIYFSLIAIGGGLGLLGSYKAERSWFDQRMSELKED
jgi:spore maturation protein SpmB